MSASAVQCHPKALIYLLVENEYTTSYFFPIVHLFVDTATYWPKIRCFSTLFF